jgi:hypothetical protein
VCECMRSIAEAHEISARFRCIIRSDRAFSTDMPRMLTIAMPRVLTSLAQELVKISSASREDLVVITLVRVSHFSRNSHHHTSVTDALRGTANRYSTIQLSLQMHGEVAAKFTLSRFSSRYNKIQHCSHCSNVPIS